jgi:hypothetical protein
MDRRYGICLGVAFFIHALAIFLYQLPKIIETRSRGARKLISVEYKEEEEKKKEKKKEEKKKKKLLTPKNPTVSLKDKLKLMKQKIKIPEEELKKLAQIAQPLKMTEKKIDISKMLKIHDTQIEMKIDQFEQLNLDEAAGELEVIHIGAGISTEDILKEDAIALPMAALKDAKLGLFTTMGAGIDGSGGGIELETEKVDGLVEEESSSFSEAAAKTAQKKIESVESSGPRTEIEISGALKDRELISYPLPPYPKWAQARGISAYLRVKVTVGPDGKIVGPVIPIQTTGFSNWDNKVINWIKTRWKWKAQKGLKSPGIIGFSFIIG